MRKSLISWLDTCIGRLREEFSNDAEALLMINAFISQYDLRSLYLLEEKSSARFLTKVKKTIKYGLQPFLNNSTKKDQSINEILKTPAQKVDLLFWPVQKMHIDVIEDIYSKIAKEHKFKTAIITNNPSISSMLKAKKFQNEIDINIESKYFVYTYTSSITNKILAAAESLPIFKFNSQSIHFKEVLKSCWSAWYWYYDYTIKVYKELVDKYRPSYIFVGNDLTLVGNTVSQLAHMDNIKIISIMHGSIKNELWKYANADYFFVFGEKDKNLMIERGRPEKNIIASGSPKIEKFLNETSKDIKDNFNTQKTILIALSGPGHSITTEHHVQILKTIYEVATELEGINFRFKLHKKDKMHFYFDLAKLPNVFIAEYEDNSVSSNIYNWILEADVLVTGASTTALDAMLMNCPVITLDLMQHLNEIDFIHEKISVHATNYNELIYSINELLKKQDFFHNHLCNSKNYIQDLYTQPKNGSVNYIVGHLKKLLNEI